MKLVLYIVMFLARLKSVLLCYLKKVLNCVILVEDHIKIKLNILEKKVIIFIN